MSKPLLLVVVSPGTTPEAINLPNFRTRLAMSKDIYVTYFIALKIWHVESYDYIRCIDQMSLAIAYIHVQ